MTKEKKIISLPLICVAALFLFNPNVTVIDLLPDFIGYILLCVAISRLADIHEKIGEAYVTFRKMIFIDGAKWLAVLWVFGMTVPSEKNTSLLLWTFVFSVLEMIFLLPAYSKLFDGITQIGYLYPNRSIFGDRGRRSNTDKIKVYTVIFILVKAILTFLPELADLANSSYDEGMSATVNLYRYIGLLRFMAFIPVFIVGFIWFVCIITYFSRIARDKCFIEAITEKYNKDVRPKVGLFVRRNFSAFMLIAIIALCLTVDVRIEFNNVLPDYLAAILFIISFAFLGKYSGYKVIRWIFPASLFTCFSILGAVCESVFFSRYYYGAIIKSDEAKYLYILLVALNIIKSAFFFWLMYELYRSVLNIIKKHTGYVVGMERSDEKEEKMISDVHYELRKELVRAFVFAAIYIVSDICFDIFAPKVNFMGLINIVCAVACIGFFIKAFSTVQNAIDTKYMLE